MKRVNLFLLIIGLLFAIGCSSDSSEQDVDNAELETEESTNTEDEESKEKESSKEEQTEKATSDTAVTITNDLRVHYIDVGQADATLFQYVHNDKQYTILFDAGDWNKKDVVSYLHEQHITEIDLVIISHPHADHIGQLAQIMDQFIVDEVWFSGNTASSGTFQQAAEAVLASDADYYEPRAGDIFEIGSLGIEVIHPSTLTGKLNEDSISARFTYGDIAFIFTGDATKNEEREMIARTDDLTAQILHVGHHGSNTSTDQSFIEAIQPEVAIYSAGVGNSYGHPHQEIVLRIEEAGIDLYGTDVHGTVVVTTDGETYGIEAGSTGTVQVGKVEKEDSSSDNKETAKESTPPTACIDINTASLEDVQQIIHIGSERAQELIDLRPFSSLDDLAQINGIGLARIADIIDENIACTGG